MAVASADPPPQTINKPPLPDPLVRGGTDVGVNVKPQNRLRVLPLGELPKDTRLGPLNGESGDFLLRPATSVDDANTRAAYVRRVMLVSMGLWPMPERTSLNAVVHGRIDLGDYSIEKVYFESIPGFFVTGNLYRPKGPQRRRAAVLSPHGHFPGGRFQDEGEDTVQEKISRGAERFDDGGRSFMQSRCVQLARMGCVVFHYDMVGYGDCQQIPLAVAHRFSRAREEFNRPPESGFYSVSALLHSNNQLGLHTWNSIRALDFLTSLPDVDPDRIAVTGGSGGGTQTFMLCGVDDRPKVSVPVVIVSADRQGGCTCENICGFRVNSHNLDITALHAPKPLLLISADDATRTMTTRGFPELQKQYQTLKASENAKHVSLTRFPHNYNYVSRGAMYEFINQHLELGLDTPIVERSYRRLARKQLSVWNDDHPQPPSDPDFEQRLLARINRDAQRTLTTLRPHDAKSLVRFREIVGGAWDVLLRNLPSDNRVRLEVKSSKEIGKPVTSLGLLSYRTMEDHDAELPVIILSPETPVGRTVIWISDSGKASLFSRKGKPRPRVQQLLAAGRTVIGVDLLAQGEYLSGNEASLRQRSLPGESGYGGWTYCYNLPLFARRVHDILAAIEFARRKDGSATKIDLIGLKQAGPLVAAALVQAHGNVDRAAVDTAGFRFAQLTDVYDQRFLPGAARSGDLPSLLSLAAPARLWLAGESTEEHGIVSSTWSASGHLERLTAYSGKNIEREAVRWLLR